MAAHQTYAGFPRRSTLCWFSYGILTNGAEIAPSWPRAGFRRDAGATWPEACHDGAGAAMMRPWRRDQPSNATG